MAAVDGSLHLGALALVLTLGYIGFDHEIRGSIADLDPILEEVRASLLETLSLRFGTSPPLDLRKPSDEFVFDKYTTYLACVLTSQACRCHPHHRILFYMKRQIDIPLFFYFTRKLDVYLVSVLCVACLVSFLGESGAELWGWPIFTDVNVDKYLFLLYALTTMWILFTVLILLRLSKIRFVSNRCRDRLERTFKIMEGFARSSVQKEIEALLDAAGSAGKAE